MCPFCGRFAAAAVKTEPRAERADGRNHRRRARFRYEVKPIRNKTFDAPVLSCVYLVRMRRGLPLWRSRAGGNYMGLRIPLLIVAAVVTLVSSAPRVSAVPCGIPIVPPPPPPAVSPPPPPAVGTPPPVFVTRPTTPISPIVAGAEQSANRAATAANNAEAAAGNAEVAAERATKSAAAATKAVNRAKSAVEATEEKFRESVTK